jgi:hypothetical protein
MTVKLAAYQLLYYSAKVLLNNKANMCELIILMIVAVKAMKQRVS